METLLPKIGDIPLCQLPIPGSHDSGTKGLPESGQTQDLSVAQQLTHGIRYFDLRPRVNRDEFYVHHFHGSDNRLARWPASGNAADINFNEESIFRDLRVFLEKNPKEVVILKFQSFEGMGTQDFNSDDHKHFRTLLNQYLPLVSPRPVSSLTLNSVLALNLKPLHNPTSAAAFGGVIVFYHLGPRSSPGPDPQPNTSDSWANFWPYLTADQQEKSSTEYIRIWDPYWHDYADWLADDDDASIAANWAPYHVRNLAAWKAMGSARFFVTQAQMEVGSGSMNITLLNSAKKNNARNVSMFADWMAEGAPGVFEIMGKGATMAPRLRPNILTMDFIQYGELCPVIMNYFGGRTKDQIAQFYRWQSFVEAGDFAIRIDASYLKVYSSEGWIVPTPNKADALRFRIWVMVGREDKVWFARRCYQVVGGSWDGYYLSMNGSYCLGLYKSSEKAGWGLVGDALYSERNGKCLAWTKDNDYVYATGEVGVLAPYDTHVFAAKVSLDWT
jgi:hypothetical protein